MPASGRFLLDTNLVIALLEGDDTVLSHLDHAPEVFIPAVVLGELFFGAAKSARQSENAATVERFAADRSIVPCDLNVAREYGSLKQRLRPKGAPDSGERHLDRRHRETSRYGSRNPRPPLPGG
jgi:tRNA(fMet)-specific endonuclease VapC